MSRTINDILDMADKHSLRAKQPYSPDRLAHYLCHECGWEVKPEFYSQDHHRGLPTLREHQVDMIRQAFPNLEDLL